MTIKTLFTLIKDDYKVNNLNFKRILVGLITNHKFYLILAFRLSCFLIQKKIPILPSLLRAFGNIFFSCDFDPNANIGKGLKLHHALGIVIGDDVVAGDYLQIFHHVTIGGRNKSIKGRTMPTIGNNVICFTGAIIIGPIYIGDNVSIGPNSVVIDDIPPNVIVSGIPAKIIKHI